MDSTGKPALSKTAPSKIPASQQQEETVSKKSVWIIVSLVGAYVVCQIIADVGATKFVQIAGVAMPAGTFVFALTFTLRDMLHKRLGKEWAKAAIIAAAGFNIFMSGYLWLMTRLPAPVWFNLADGWDAIFSIVPSIAIGSIIAEMVSELIDTEVYHFWRNKFATAPQWSRVLVSNLVSIPIDSIVFSVLAFAVLPAIFGGDKMSIIDAIIRAASGQVIYKALVTIFSLPGIYLVKDEPLEPVLLVE